MADWIGGTQNVMATLNATSHAINERAESDFYATPQSAVEKLLELEQFTHNVWECACGKGHISEVLKLRGYSVTSTDIIDRGYGGVLDFLTCTEKTDSDIVSNPPFKFAQEFVEKAIELVRDGGKVVFLLRIQFLEGVKRKKLFRKCPPRKVYVASRNIRCARNGDFEHATGNASTYAWFVWEKGNADLPVLDWFN